jgi:TPR repeat protein
VLAAGVVGGAIALAVVVSSRTEPSPGPAAAKPPEAPPVSSAATSVAVIAPNAALPPVDADHCRAALANAAKLMSGDVPLAAHSYRHLAKLAGDPARAADFEHTCTATYDPTIVACLAGAHAPQEVADCGDAFVARRCEAGEVDDCSASAWAAYDRHRDERAVELAQRACTGTSGSGCTLVGLTKLVGRGTAVDLDGARAAFERGVTLGDVDAVTYRAQALRYGLGEPVSATAARKLYEDGCARVPDHSVCAGLGDMERQGEGGPVDLAAAEKHLKAVCDAEIGTGCLFLGDLHAAAKASPDDDYARARAILEKQAPEFPSSKARFATMLRDGKGGAADPLVAARLFDEACASNEWLACQWAGQVRTGGLIDVSVPRAREAYARACSAKLPTGCAATACYALLDKADAGDELARCKEQGFFGPVVHDHGTQLRHKSKTDLREPTAPRKNSSPTLDLGY